MSTDLQAYDPDNRFDAYDKNALRECLLAQQEHPASAPVQESEKRDGPHD